MWLWRVGLGTIGGLRHRRSDYHFRVIYELGEPLDTVSHYETAAASHGQMTPLANDEFSSWLAQEVADLRQVVAARSRESDDAFNLALSRVTDQHRANWKEMQDRYVQLAMDLTRMQESRLTETRITEERMRTASHRATWVSMLVSAGIALGAIWWGR